MLLFSVGNVEADGVGWCNIAYWEHNQRIGSLHQVTEPTVTVANICSENGTILFYNLRSLIIHV